MIYKTMIVLSLLLGAIAFGLMVITIQAGMYHLALINFVCLLACMGCAAANHHMLYKSGGSWS